MEISTDIAVDVPLHSDFNKKKKKCLTNSEYNAMAHWIDSLINDNTDFILNKFGLLYSKVLSQYSHLHENTVFSIIDSRVQFYVRQRHRKVFNHTTNTNSPLHSSATASTSAANTPMQSPSHHQFSINKRIVNSTNTMYERYKEIVATDSDSSPLMTLANNLRMPAMLVAKVVLSDQINYEKMKKQLGNQINITNENNQTNSALSDRSSATNDSNVGNNSIGIMSNNSVNNSAAIDLDYSSVDGQLSQQLNWLTNKLLSMKKAKPIDEQNQSNSSINSNSHSEPTISKSLNFTPHQLATSTWLIRTDPQLAYQVFKCSVVDGYYGACVEFIKSCTGKRYEQLLKQSMTSVVIESKPQANKLEKCSLYTTEKECRLRGLDMTPDMVLNEPIALVLSNNDDDIKENHEYIATNYSGGNDNSIRVLNWIESKALFGGPEQLRTHMQRQLFPYWNRYGPGAVIYWFGYILEDNEKDHRAHTNILTNKSTTDPITTANANSSTKIDTIESSTFNFWSKYCVLMDGFPETNKIVMYNHWNNNNQNCIKKKTTTVLTQ